MTMQLPLVPAPPPPVRRAWWVSTPGWTCLVETDTARQIVHAAPLLRRWRGQPLQALVVWCLARWDAPTRVELLPRKGTTP
jgi:hypothetical protein